MTDEEQIERNKVIQQRLQRYSVKRWAMDFVDSLMQVKKTSAGFEYKEAHR